MLPVLDGVRGLAILLVIWQHIGSLSAHFALPLPLLIRMAPGWGLELFFVLSGFLLFRPYARAILTGAPWPSVRRFYAHRMRRILPAYYVTLAPLVVLALLFVRPFPLTPLALAATLLHDMSAQAWSALHTYDVPLWSLAIEWQFYLILPWLALLLALLARLGKRWLALGLGCLIVVGLGLRALAAVAHYGWQWADPVQPLLYGVKGKYLEIFALGMLAAVGYVAGVEQRRLSARHARQLAVAATLAALGGISLCTLAAPTLLGSAQNAWIWPASPAWDIFGEWVFSLCSVLLLAGALLAPPALRAVWSFTPLRIAGRISFSTYLWHYPILVACLSFAAGRPAFIATLMIAVGVVLALCAGALSYRFVERPFLSRSASGSNSAAANTARPADSQHPAPAAPPLVTARNG